MNKIIYINSCIVCPYVEVDRKDFLYCNRSAGRNIGHEDKIKHFPKWCKLKNIANNNKE